MREAVIVSAVRTAIGSFGGMLKDVPAATLGACAIKAALERKGIPLDQVDEVIMGNVLQAAQGQNPGRQAAMGAGLPQEIPSFTVNKVCASGLKSVILAAQAVKTGDAELVVAGGMENMSRTPYALSKTRWGARMGHDQLIDLMIHDGLWEIFYGYHMGITAENVAEKWGISREQQDRFGYRSQMRAKEAIETGRFKDEIVPVEVPQRKGEAKRFEIDEHPRPDTTLEAMAKLKPAFKKEGTVTAGNASGINDSAAAVVVASDAKAKELGLAPMAVITAYASAGVDPAYMGTGPIPACRKALSMAGYRMEQIDLVELNEAFAAQALACVKELEIDIEKLNPNGGAIALGHPIGASGARILTTLLFEMQKRDARKGLASLCIGGGQGTALVVER